MEKIRKVNFLFLLGFLLSLGVVDFSTVQWESFSPEVRGTNIESGRFWSTDKYLLHPRPEGPKGHRIPLSLPEGRVLKLNQAEIISGIIKGDFLVNDETTGGCNQEYPTIAMDHSGSFVICWQDYRNYDWDIYAKRFDRAGHPLGSDFIVNNRHARIYEGSSFPSIAMDNHGNFVVCWLDYRNTGPLENPDIYAQIFSSSGNRSGGNFKVNDDTGSNWQTPPSISMDADGDFVICWGDWRDQRWDIYAQRYSRFGHAVDRNFRVTDDSAKVWRQTSPSVAMDKGGDFVICWMDYRNGDVDIYAQRYENSGYKIGINFMVNDDVGTNSQSSPSVAAGAHGDFVICWVDRRDDGNNCDIYAQRYNSSGQPIC